MVTTSDVLILILARIQDIILRVMAQREILMATIGSREG
jgi:hypothetical protein